MKNRFDVKRLLSFFFDFFTLQPEIAVEKAMMLIDYFVQVSTTGKISSFFHFLLFLAIWAFHVATLSFRHRCDMDPIHLCTVSKQ
jgi:hypothetical protein